MNWSKIYIRVIVPAACFVLVGAGGACIERAARAARDPVPIVQSADLNQDGAVDLLDFAIFQNQMGGPIPEWLQDLIDWFEAGEGDYAPEYVWQYRYDGEVVYYLPYHSTVGNSPFIGIVFDAYGAMVCWHDLLDLGECSDFFAKRTNEILIWEDGR